MSHPLSTHEVRRVAWETVCEMLGLGIESTFDATVVFQAKSFTAATLPDAATYPRGLVYVSDEAGGSVLAFSDGSAWRRTTDRVVVS